MTRFAKVSALSHRDWPHGYPLAYDWPADCFVQAGSRGLVLKGDGGSYSTAFFEAFPRNPDCFLRGEGATIREAESQCWQKYESILACPGHEYERREREDGYAYCRHCAFSGRVLEPTTTCFVCAVPTRHGRDVNGEVYCEEHYDELPPELWDRTRQMVEEMKGEQVAPATREEMSQAFSAVISALFAPETPISEDEGEDGPRKN